MSILNKILLNCFPPLGTVNNSRTTVHDWQLHVSYFGNLSVTGNCSGAELDLSLGINVVDALALEVDGQGIGTRHGAITRYSEDPDTLRVIVHHYTIFIDRNKLLDLASC